jgi:predicted MFS family arabinose efflux permease
MVFDIVVFLSLVGTIAVWCYAARPLWRVPVLKWLLLWAFGATALIAYGAGAILGGLVLERLGAARVEWMFLTGFLGCAAFCLFVARTFRPT